ncbi:MAG: hydroxymyristoyl-ACP dehydratase [Mediterranea massiliensis]|nr:hydroxymyristoyl-ACP dehydratase [Mediterranea massiliensis]
MLNMENRTPILQGEELLKLIPQRAPIVMVDAIYEVDAAGATTGLTITNDNIFCSQGCLQEVGLIEHIAQSAAALAGYEPFKQGLPPKPGFIGEIKKCKLHRLPYTGETLHTRLEVKGEAAGVTLIAAQTCTTQGLVATCQMKIFISPE